MRHAPLQGPLDPETLRRTSSTREVNGGEHHFSGARSISTVALSSTFDVAAIAGFASMASEEPIQPNAAAFLTGPTRRPGLGTRKQESGHGWRDRGNGGRAHPRPVSPERERAPTGSRSLHRTLHPFINGRGQGPFIRPSLLARPLRTGRRTHRLRRGLIPPPLCLRTLWGGFGGVQQRLQRQHAGGSPAGSPVPPPDHFIEPLDRTHRPTLVSAWQLLHQRRPAWLFVNPSSPRS